MTGQQFDWSAIDGLAHSRAEHKYGSEAKRRDEAISWRSLPAKQSQSEINEPIQSKRDSRR